MGGNPKAMFCLDAKKIVQQKNQFVEINLKLLKIRIIKEIVKLNINI